MERRNAIDVTLRRLEQYASLSPFSRVFYRFIQDLLRTPGGQADRMAQAFHLFLRIEHRRHQAVRRIAQRGQIDVPEIAVVGRSVHDLLERLRRAVATMEVAHPRQGIIRELVLAECCYHLGHTDSVIRSLRRATDFGCRHPLAHFALGYNLYASAFKRYRRARNRGQPEPGTGFPAFEAACREAIAAFGRGLGDTAFDAQIHWWIGVISEVLGEEEGARMAFGQALKADPRHFRERVQRKLESFEHGRAPRRSASERERIAELTPITDQEITEARDTLGGCESFPSFFLDLDDA